MRHSYMCAVMDLYRVVGPKGPKIDQWPELYRSKSKAVMRQIRAGHIKVQQRPVGKPPRKYVMKLYKAHFEPRVHLTDIASVLSGTGKMTIENQLAHLDKLAGEVKTSAEKEHKQFYTAGLSNANSHSSIAISKEQKPIEMDTFADPYDFSDSCGSDLLMYKPFASQRKMVESRTVESFVKNASIVLKIRTNSVSAKSANDSVNVVKRPDDNHEKQLSKDNKVCSPASEGNGSLEFESVPEGVSEENFIDDDDFKLVIDEDQVNDTQMCITNPKSELSGWTKDVVQESCANKVDLPIVKASTPELGFGLDKLSNNEQNNESNHNHPVSGLKEDTESETHFSDDLQPSVRSSEHSTCKQQLETNNCWGAHRLPQLEIIKGKDSLNVQKNVKELPTNLSRSNVTHNLGTVTTVTPTPFCESSIPINIKQPNVSEQLVKVEQNTHSYDNFHPEIVSVRSLSQDSNEVIEHGNEKAQVAKKEDRKVSSRMLPRTEGKHQHLQSVKGRGNIQASSNCINKTSGSSDNVKVPKRKQIDCANSHASEINKNISSTPQVKAAGTKHWKKRRNILTTSSKAEHSYKKPKLSTQTDENMTSVTKQTIKDNKPKNGMKQQKLTGEAPNIGGDLREDSPGLVAPERFVQKFVNNNWLDKKYQTQQNEPRGKDNLIVQTKPAAAAVPPMSLSSGNTEDSLKIPHIPVPFHATEPSSQIAALKLHQRAQIQQATAGKVNRLNALSNRNPVKPTQVNVVKPILPKCTNKDLTIDMPETSKSSVTKTNASQTTMASGKSELSLTTAEHISINGNTHRQSGPTLPRTQTNGITVSTSPAIISAVKDKRVSQTQETPNCENDVTGEKAQKVPTNGSSQSNQSKSTNAPLNAQQNGFLTELKKHFQHFQKMYKKLEKLEKIKEREAQDLKSQVQEAAEQMEKIKANISVLEKDNKSAKSVPAECKHQLVEKETVSGEVSTKEEDMAVHVLDLSNKSSTEPVANPTDVTKPEDKEGVEKPVDNDIVIIQDIKCPQSDSPASSGIQNACENAGNGKPEKKTNSIDNQVKSENADNVENVTDNSTPTGFSPVKIVADIINEILENVLNSETAKVDGKEKETTSNHLKNNTPPFEREDSQSRVRQKRTAMRSQGKSRFSRPSGPRYMGPPNVTFGNRTRVPFIRSNQHIEDGHIRNNFPPFQPIRQPFQPVVQPGVFAGTSMSSTNQRPPHVPIAAPTRQIFQDPVLQNGHSNIGQGHVTNHLVPVSVPQGNHISQVNCHPQPPAARMPNVQAARPGMFINYVPQRIDQLGHVPQRQFHPTFQSHGGHQNMVSWQQQQQLAMQRPSFFNHTANENSKHLETRPQSGENQNLATNQKLTEHNQSQLYQNNTIQLKTNTQLAQNKMTVPSKDQVVQNKDRISSVTTENMKPAPQINQTTSTSSGSNGYVQRNDFSSSQKENHIKSPPPYRERVVATQITTNENTSSISTFGSGLKNLKCAVCGKKAIFICSGCKKVPYCCQKCQNEAWRSHSKDCK